MTRLCIAGRGLFWGMLLTAMVMTGGCSTPPSAIAKQGSGSKATAKGSTNAVPTLRPLGGTMGRVVQVNERLRFVVLEFALNPIPAYGQHLELVRNEVVCGEVKVSTFRRGTSVAADLVSGTAAVNDMVRAK